MKNLNFFYPNNTKETSKLRMEKLFNIFKEIYALEKVSVDFSDNSKSNISSFRKIISLSDISIIQNEKINFKHQMDEVIKGYRIYFSKKLKNIKNNSNQFNSIMGSEYEHPDAAHIVEVKSIKKNFEDSKNEKSLIDIGDPNNGLLLEPNIHRRLDLNILYLNKKYQFINIEKDEQEYELLESWRTNEGLKFIKQRLIDDGINIPTEKD